MLVRVSAAVLVRVRAVVVLRARKDATPKSKNDTACMYVPVRPALAFFLAIACLRAPGGGEWSPPVAVAFHSTRARAELQDR